MNNPKISVIVTVYNHERYLQQCLDSILSQKTQYPFEIIVHDDASTDMSPSIIREYYNRYPTIIVPILQTINQYSQHIGIVATYIIPRIRGQYIASCEGDDYWVSNDKLEIQCNYMLSHPECALCFHKAEMTYNGKNIGYIAPFNKDCAVDPYAVIAGGGGYMSTNSMMSRVQDYTTAREMDFFKNAPVGDAPLQAYLATSGTIFYFNRVMSAYRTMSEGSWSQSMANAPVEHTIALNSSLIEMYNSFEVYCDGHYRDAINDIRNFYILSNVLIENGARAILFSKDYRVRLQNLPFAFRLTVYTSAISPALCMLLKKIKKFIKCL